MTAHIDTARWTTELFAVLSETFERVDGIYLDRGTSLLETLATVSAAEASRPVASQCASIAAQVNHVCYYLDVILAYMRDQPPEHVDWAGSWQVSAVSSAEWEALRQRFHDTYQRVRTQFASINSWDGDEDISGALSIVVHTAYHLGEIRQALGVLRS